MDSLTQTEYAFILESLGYTKLKFSNYAHYPSYEYKRARIAEVEALIDKVRALRNAHKGLGKQ